MVKVLSVNGKIPLVDGKAISATGGGGGASLTDDDIINALYETGIINPVTDSGGKILLASDNNILTL